MAAETTTRVSLDDTAYVSLRAAGFTNLSVFWREGNAVRIVVGGAQPVVDATNFFTIGDKGIASVAFAGVTNTIQLWARMSYGKGAVAVVGN